MGTACIQSKIQGLLHTEAREGQPGRPRSEDLALGGPGGPGLPASRAVERPGLGAPGEVDSVQVVTRLACHPLGRGGARVVGVENWCRVRANRRGSMRREWAREASWTPWWLPGSFCPGAASGVDTALVGGGRGCHHVLLPGCVCFHRSLWRKWAWPVGAALCHPVCLDVRAGGWAPWRPSPRLTEKADRLAWRLLPLGRL